VSDPYEPPTRAEVVVDTGVETVQDSLQNILSKLEALGLVKTVGQFQEVRS
jgi:adenylylsulfate kinase-like enzyme